MTCIRTLPLHTDGRSAQLAAQRSALLVHGASPVACSGAGVPLMAAGGGAGVITVWNLEEQRLHTVLRDAHDAPLTALHFFAGEPRLMSAGADNALKQWVRARPVSAAANSACLHGVLI